MTQQLNLGTIPAFLTLLVHTGVPEFPWPLILFAALLGALLGNFPMQREIEPSLTFRVWGERVATISLLRYPVWIVTLVTAVAMPARFGWPVWAMMGGFLIVHFALQYGLGLRVMRGLHLLKPASPRLQALVDETCAQMGMKANGTWELAWAEANAVALPTTRQLAFSQKLLHVCSDDEVKAICAHELGHLSEPRWILAVRIAGTLVVLPLILIAPVCGHFPQYGLAGLLLAFVIIMGLNARLSRAMEKRADQVARETTAETAVYARALERLHEASLIPAVQPPSSGRTHPDLFDRMTAAGVTPAYPKPAAPAKQGWTSYLMLAASLMLFMYQ